MVDTAKSFTEIPSQRFLEAEDQFNFQQQFGRAESEAKAGVADAALSLVRWWILGLFATIAVLVGVDQYNLVVNLPHQQIITDRVVWVLITGVTVSVGSLCLALVKMDLFAKSPENSRRRS